MTARLYLSGHNTEIMKKIALFVCLFCVFGGFAFAAEKTWSGGGDGASWSDAENWFSPVVPISTDDVLIDSEDAAVTCDDTWRAQSLTLGGFQSITLTSENFVFGVISTEEATDTAILNRKDGKLTLQGDGIITVQGQYKDSEETLIAEPSFMFWIE